MGDLNTQLKKPTVTVLLIGLTLLSLGTAAILYTIEGPGNYGWGGKAPESVQKDDSATKEAEKPKTSNVTFTAVANKTVLEQLQAKATVVVQESTYGKYVDSINGIKGGTDDKYWVYYVDGQMATIGANELVTKGGEEISWRFE